MKKTIASFLAGAFLMTLPAIAATQAGPHQSLLQKTAAKKTAGKKTPTPKATKKPSPKPTPKPSAKPTKKP